MSTKYVAGECLFTKINKNIRQYNYLTEDINCDVIIVGGGITGAILGYYFSKNNIKAVILEKGRVGYCSTSITTSLLEYELDVNASELEKYISIENIERAYNLDVKALDEIEGFVERYGNKCGYKKCDSLLYTAKELDKKELKEEYNFRKKAGFDVEFINEDNNNYTFDIKAGILSKKGGATFDPYRYTHHLLEVSCDMGLKVYENTEVIKINYEEDGVIAETGYGNKVAAKIIVAATGYNTKLFTKKDFGEKTTTFNIATEPIDNIDDIYKNLVIRDNNDPYNYVRTTEDNRLIIGGEDRNVSIDDENKDIFEKCYDNLEKKLKAMFPKLDIKIEYKYCGTFASTKDNLGFIGKDPDNNKLWYGLGYGANGILFATLAGIMLSKLYLDEVDKNMELFRVNR